MLIHIQPGSSTPIYVQIMEQIKHAVASGTAKEGEKLPSVRELARRLRITPNTVAKAYHELEREKILVTHKGKGVYVAEHKQTLSQTEKERLVGEKLEYALVEALNLGLDLEQVKKILEERMQKLYQARKEQL